jgi:hypothetical protein
MKNKSWDFHMFLLIIHNTDKRGKKKRKFQQATATTAPKNDPKRPNLHPSNRLPLFFFITIS